MEASRLLRPCLAACAVLIMANPVLAANEGDGRWDCFIGDDAPWGNLTISGSKYVFTALDGEGGEGSLSYQDVADPPALVLLDGPLVSRYRALGAAVHFFSSGTQLVLVDHMGSQVTCRPSA